VSLNLPKFLESDFIQNCLKKNDLDTVYKVLCVNDLLRERFTDFLNECDIDPNKYVSDPKLISGEYEL